MLEAENGPRWQEERPGAHTRVVHKAAQGSTPASGPAT